MHAQVDIEIPPQKKRRPRRRTKVSRSHQVAVVETLAKITINSLLAIVGSVAMVRLLSYQATQQAKIVEIQNQLIDTEQRVSKLRQNFAQSFDSTKIVANTQKYSPQIFPKQKRVYIIPSQHN